MKLRNSSLGKPILFDYSRGSIPLYLGKSARDVIESGISQMGQGPFSFLQRPFSSQMLGLYMLREMPTRSRFLKYSSPGNPPSKCPVWRLALITVMVADGAP